MASIEKVRIKPKSGALSLNGSGADGIISQILRDDNVIQWDASNGTTASITLDSTTPSRLFSFPFNIQDRTRYTLILRQDNRGGAGISFDSAFRFPNGSPRIGTEANSAYRIEFMAKRDKAGNTTMESICVSRIG